MKSIRDKGSTKNKPRNKVIMFSLALGLLVVVSTSAISSLELVKPVMAKTDKKLITTADIADNAVTSPKIKDGEVKTSDIEDGTIAGNDVSPSFMIKKTLDDEVAGKGWDPGGGRSAFLITDNDVKQDTSMIQLYVEPGSDDEPLCLLQDIFNGSFEVNCPIPGNAPANDAVLHYTITNLPENVVTSSLSVLPSSTSSSTPTISSPFSSLGDINPK